MAAIFEALGIAILIGVAASLGLLGLRHLATRKRNKRIERGIDAYLDDLREESWKRSRGRAARRREARGKE